MRGAIQVAELLLQEGARVNTADMYGYQVSFTSFQLYKTFIVEENGFTFDDGSWGETFADNIGERHMHFNMNIISKLVEGNFWLFVK